MTTFETIFLNQDPPDDERISRLVYWGQTFHKSGLVPGAAGNLSFRAEKGFIITGSGARLGNLQREDLVKVSEVNAGKSQISVYAEGCVVPSKESLLHWEIYRLKAQINTVFHTHDRLVVKFAGELGLPVTERMQPRGSYELAKEAGKLVSSIENLRYFVLKRHGIVSLSESMYEAGRLVEAIHKMALGIKRERGKTVV